MILGEKFEHDFLWVQRLQNELYWSVVTLPFITARELYLKAERTIGIETQIGKDCRNIDGVDHRILRCFHDTIATKFRYESRNKFQMHLPGMLDGISEDDSIKQRWLGYLKDQINYMFDLYPNLLRQVIVAGTYPNPDKRGIDAEDFIETICDNIISSIKENEDRLLYERMKMGYVNEE